MRTFVAVADTGQFSEAAASLSITQQAVSKRVAGLEKDLGVRLFARTARGGLRRVPIRDPVPVYPHALIWRPDNPHPALATLRAHLRTIKPIVPNASTWTPAWA